MINAAILRKIAELNLPADTMQAVMLIIADVQEAEEKRRADGRQRTIKWREAQALKRHRDVTEKNTDKSTIVKRHRDSHDPLLSSSSLLPSSIDKPLSEFQESKEVVVEGRGASDWPSDYRELFWQTYPNKVGKPKALAKLDAARAHGVLWIELWAGLGRYVAKTDDRPWCNPETWLNQERWTDEPAKTNGGGAHGKRNLGADRAHELAEQVRQREFEIGFGRPPKHERGR